MGTIFRYPTRRREKLLAERFLFFSNYLEEGGGIYAMCDHGSNPVHWSGSADYYASPFAPISFSYPGLTGPIELAFSLSSNRLPSSSSSSASRASRLRIGGRNYCDIGSLPPRSIRYVWMTSPFGHAALRVAHV